MTTDHNELRALALAATPGPWQAQQRNKQEAIDSVTDALQPAAWIRKNGFRFIAEAEPQDDSETALYSQTAIDTLRAQLAEAQKNEKRWRYLRDSGDDSIYAMRFDVDGDTPISGADLDVSIDAAMGESNA